MRYFDLKLLIGFLIAYRIDRLHVAPYKATDFPSFEYLIEINHTIASVVAAIPIETETCSTLITQKIQKIKQRWLKDNDVQQSPWPTLQTLQTDLNALIQLPIFIKENTPAYIYKTTPPQLPIALNKPHHLNGIKHINRWSITILIGPITYDEYMTFMFYGWLHERLNAYIKKNFGMLWRFCWMIEILRSTCLPPRLGTAMLGIDSWLGSHPSGHDHIIS